MKNYNRNNKILITGGAGFLGSHLTENLLKEGNEVLVVDNFFTGTKQNLAHLLGNPNLEVMRHDVTFPLYVETNQIYNLACPASPVHYQYDPVQTTKTSVHGAINMLGLAKRTRARILQASTSEVYGDPEVHPQPEEYWGKVNPIGIRSCYDEGKRCAETLFFDYHRQHQLDIKVVRIFNTYGPRMHPNDGRVVSNFIVQALQGKDITIYGDGQQTRSFCYVDDLIDAMVKMMNSEYGFTGPVNIGNPGEFTMLQLAETILKLSGGKSKIIHQPLPSDDPKQRQPNIELAKGKLAWEPKVNLEDGLKETIAYFKKVVAQLPLEKSEKHFDRIRSFVLRAGRTTAGQQRAIDELGPQFLIPFQENVLDLRQIFAGSSHPKILEIGFGMGETTAKIAALRAEDDFLAIEVHPPGVGALLKLIGENQLTNLRLIRHDAVEVLEKMIAPNSLDGIHIYFADPWHKKRHHKRRLIQAEFVRLLASRLKPGTYLHLATDWHNYAEQMLLVLNAESDLENASTDQIRIETFSATDVASEIELAKESFKEFKPTLEQIEAKHSGYVERPAYRPTTKFETRGIKLGHGVWDLVYKKK